MERKREVERRVERKREKEDRGREDFHYNTSLTGENIRKIFIITLLPS